MVRFESVYQNLPSPVPAAIQITRHILVSPASLFEAPLSRPVLERLRWIKPSLEDERESYLYFNNMVDHGASGRVHDLRMELIHAGTSSWQFCGPDEVQYKTDQNSLDSDGLCEIFCRVTVWKIRENEGAIPAKEKLALILKLETDQAQSSRLNFDAHPASWADQLSWKYFDLQDIVTPGLDTRPWFATPIHAAGHGNHQTSINTDEDDGEDYWAGFSSATDDSSLTSGSVGQLNQSIPTDPALVARLRNTPLYRSKAPSVSSTTNSNGNASPQKHVTPLLGTGPQDLRARLSRTPLYKRAPSVDQSPPALFQGPPPHIDLDRLLEAARIVNQPTQNPVQIPSSCPASLPSPQAPSQAPPPHHQTPIPSSYSATSQTDLPDKLVDSLRATFHLYRFCLQASDSASGPSSSALSPGESFLALAHRAVLLESSNENH